MAMAMAMAHPSGRRLSLFRVGRGCGGAPGANQGLDRRRAI